jgi:hypothetical protein
MRLTLLAVAAIEAVTLVAAAPRHWTRQHTSFEATTADKLGGWKWVSKPHPSQLIDLKIALRESGDIYEHLAEVSDPEHHRYGKHVRYYTSLPCITLACMYELIIVSFHHSCPKKRLMNSPLQEKRHVTWSSNGSYLTAFETRISTPTG